MQVTNVWLHKKVHFIGIGGISMSAIAQILLARGATVSGSDICMSQATARLKASGANIEIGHRDNNLNGADLVVYTAAISKDNVELIKAKKSGIPVMERADFLGVLMQDYKKPIAVSGTHGKTTTTAMLACVLLYAGYNPTVLVGGDYPLINGNLRIGGTDLFIFEACEYVDSFLKFNPYAAIVLNIEEDHLDYFADINSIVKSFKGFIKKIPKDGFVVLNSDDKNVMACANSIQSQRLLFGAKGDYAASDLTIFPDGTSEFSVCNKAFSERVKLNVEGLHNISNSLAVFAAAHKIGIAPSIISKGLESFKGIKRRFEFIGKVNGARLFDDYAHHPTEIAATLKTAKKMPHNIVWCVFQPHTYTRTKALLDDFVSALSFADRVIVTDIYAAREKNDGTIHSKMIAEKSKNALYISNFSEIVAFLKENVRGEDIIITMGAGTVTDISQMLIK